APRGRFPSVGCAAHPYIPRRWRSAAWHTEPQARPIARSATTSTNIRQLVVESASRSNLALSPRSPPHCSQDTAVGDMLFDSETVAAFRTYPGQPTSGGLERSTVQ